MSNIVVTKNNKNSFENIKSNEHNLPFSKNHNPLNFFKNIKYKKSFLYNINFYKKIHEILIEYIKEKKLVKVYWTSEVGNNMQATISSTILSETNLNDKNNKNIILMFTFPVIDIFNEKTMNIRHNEIIRIPIDAENLKIGSIPFFDFIQQQINEQQINEHEENL
jgi:hypothetical protein